jgi:2'-5' RNA ligase
MMDLVPISEYWDLILKSQGAPFVGIIFRVPMRLWREIAKIQSELEAIDPRQLYARPSTFHVTIKGLGFLGEKFDDDKLETILNRISSVLGEFHSFNLKFRGLGMFPRSIYVKVEDSTDQLRMINKRLSQELGSEIDLSEYDGDSYIPHVTIATFATKEADSLIRKLGSEESKDIEIGETRVFEVEAVQANMTLALGPKETQDRAYGYLRSFHLNG